MEYIQSKLPFFGSDKNGTLLIIRHGCWMVLIFDFCKTIQGIRYQTKYIVHHFSTHPPLPCSSGSGNLKSTDWSADSAAKLLWSLARYGKGEEIKKHKQVEFLGRSRSGFFVDLVEVGRFGSLPHFLWGFYNDDDDDDEEDDDDDDDDDDDGDDDDDEDDDVALLWALKQDLLVVKL